MDDRTLGAYDLAAGAFAEEWLAQPVPVDLQAGVRKYFRPGPTADIGCGAGRDTAWLNDNGFPTVGYEPSSGLLGEARRRYPALEFRQSGLPELHGVADRSLANVLCETVIMHLEPSALVPSVRKLVDVLAPGGTLYLSWRVTEGADRRDEHGRLYAAFDADVVLNALTGLELLVDEEVVSASSGKKIHRVVARYPG